MGMLPSLDILFGHSPGRAAAVVTMPDHAPISMDVVRQPAFNERFPGDPGNNSLTKGRPRFALRLDKMGVMDVPYGTTIEIGAESWSVEATDVLEPGRVAHVLARQFTPPAP